MPKLNFDATSISQLTDLEKAVTEPPLVIDLTDQEVLALVDTPLVVDLPIHTSAIERMVQVTTQAATVSSDSKIQDGFSHQRITARLRNKGNHSKKWNV